MDACDVVAGYLVFRRVAGLHGNTQILRCTFSLMQFAGSVTKLVTVCAVRPFD